MSAALDWLALALTVGVIAAAVGAAMARSLFAMCMYLAAAGALAAGALLAHGAAEAALGGALLSVGIAPFMLLAVLLLSARTEKPRRTGRPWYAIAAAFAVAGALLWTLPDLGVRPGAAALGATPIAMWLAPLVFVGVAACFALLGFGERGAFEHAPERDL